MVSDTLRRLFDPRLRQWRHKQRVAAPSRYYGNGGTIHASGHLDIVLDADLTVSKVWFRCQELPFIVHVHGRQAYGEITDLPLLTGVEVLDRG